MNPEASKHIKEIQKSKWAWYKKSTICKLAMMRHEIFREMEEAEEYCKLSIHYEYLNPAPFMKEINGLKRHLKTIQKKKIKGGKPANVGCSL